MTRWILLMLVGSVAVVWFDPGGYRWVGVANLAVIAGVGGLKVRSAVRRQAAKKTIEGLRLLHPDDFEAEVGRWLRRDGWRTEFRGGAGDGGIDIVARRRGETLAVQCKRYAESAAVSAAQVRDLYGAAVAEGSTRALLVTTGRVSRAARAWCEALPDGIEVCLFEAESLGAVATGRTKISAAWR